jgi:hypothetical protein
MQETTMGSTSEQVRDDLFFAQLRQKVWEDFVEIRPRHPASQARVLVGTVASLVAAAGVQRPIPGEGTRDD